MKAAFRQGAILIAILCSPAAFTAQQQDDVVDSDVIAESLAAPTTRGLTRAIGVRQKKKVDLNIPFEVNSSELKPEARRQLRQLVDALSRESLAEFRFQVAGHTDASGAADYNLELSERRANAVMQYLVENGIDPERLVAVGYGEDELLLSEDPESSENRRVEIINIGATTGN